MASPTLRPPPSASSRGQAGGSPTMCWTSWSRCSRLPAAVDVLTSPAVASGLPRSSWVGSPAVEPLGQCASPSRGSDMSEPFFTNVTGRIPFGGLESTDPLSYKVYDPDRLVLGKRMEDHLRLGVCVWHSFAWPGTDMFGVGTLDRPWLAPGRDPMAAAREKMAAAFEFLSKLGVPYYCFHDIDVAPAGRTFAESRANLDALADEAAGYQERTGLQLLWGTA